MNAPVLPLLQRVSAAQVHAARLAAKLSDRSIFSELEQMVGLPPSVLVEELGDTLGMLPLSLERALALAPDFATLPFAECARRLCLVVPECEGRAVLVITDPFDDALMAWAQTRFFHSTIALMHPEEFSIWLARCEEQLRAMPDGAASEVKIAEVSSSAERLSLARIGSDTSPIVRFVNSTLYDALRLGASDIHFESNPTGLIVKFRLDGVLTVAGHMDGIANTEQVISRIKVMAELDIAERRIPQDGRLQVIRSERAVDVRVSIMPSIHGEDAVLRILDRQALADELSGLSLSVLGFEPEMVDAIRRFAKQPYGMLLVTGPTGSGKTTTLYAALTETTRSEEKTITIEDPVEYHLPNVLQIPVNEKKGLTFAKGLRSILRHDPDRILVGEIRDAETAQIAVQSALTGHLVFTTVHANSVLDVFGRFLQFGIDPYSFVSALNGILAQRLLRRLCPLCKRPGRPSPGAVQEGEVAAAQIETGNWMCATGCANCRGTGYKGRFAIGELLKLNNALRSLIAERATLLALESAAREAGLVTLRQKAIRAALAGETTLDEINRVTCA